jgi:hypothetical protein
MKQNMIRKSLPSLMLLGIALSTGAVLAAPLTELKSVKLDLPSSDAMFPAGPGADEANNNCLACHSADHVMNQPLLTEEGWSEVVHKMVTAYKAPISPDDEKTIVAYLAHIKGKP